MTERKKGPSRKDIRSSDSRPLRRNLTAGEMEGGTYIDFINLINKKKEGESSDDNPSGQINPELLK